MLLEAFVSDDLNKYFLNNMYDNVCSTTTQHYIHSSTSTSNLFKNNVGNSGGILFSNNESFEDLTPLDSSSSMQLGGGSFMKTQDDASNSTTPRSRKRSRRPRVCKNKEEAETQRMTHITVERNRRKQMNEYLAVLRSLMPESYTQRGDQASIVGGAIEYVKELEQLLQSLEAQKRQQTQKEGTDESSSNFFPPPFSQFFSCPQFSWCQIPGDNPSENRTAIADIEVTLIESHANLRILSRKRPHQLFKMVAGFQNLQLTILHLNVTTLDPLVFYSLSAKVEEGCHLNSVDDIANAVHHMLRIIEEEGAL
ncbi:hypothetical protein AQUCO_00500478v1 [Aquilegia coerulea]|uniref:BHLH domain-containing protein n=1 Tax=Aquilegia coerulea TaxID=218851 RepID=A0A2G5ESA9_AQUCA|nr:hypothetical protein AQUCO_00500478v1 [Aquilegia coerulea]